MFRHDRIAVEDIAAIENKVVKLHRNYGSRTRAVTNNSMHYFVRFSFELITSVEQQLPVCWRMEIWRHRADSQFLHVSHDKRIDDRFGRFG